MFNSLKYAKKLEEVGVSREQAEMHMQILSDIVEGNLATREDIKDLRRDITEVELRLSNRFDKFEDKFVQLEQRMTIKLGTLFIIGFTSMATLMKFWLIH